MATTNEKLRFVTPSTRLTENPDIGVWRELGQGITFDLYCPRVEKPSIDTPGNQVGPAKGGTETVLIVEDEVSLRKLARRVLEKLGYKVLSASNGDDGLRVAREHKGAPIRLVITDVIMPVMGGRVMAEKLIADYPDLKILFTSGYTDDVTAPCGVFGPEKVHLLLKPHTSAALVRKVRDLLDEPPIAPREPMSPNRQDQLCATADNGGESY